MNATPTDTELTDALFMARALKLAEQGFYSTRPNPRVGCVIVRRGEVVGEGYHRRAGEAHAEVNALRAAGAAARGATVYVTLEPCAHQGRTPPCTKALIGAGVARVVYACADPNPKVGGRGAHHLSAAGIEVRAPLLEPAAHALNRGFILRMRERRPFVTVKLGMSVDAKLALASGASRWITSVEARADVQRLRAASGAIVTGVGTILADDPLLTVRDPRFDIGTQQPLRVVLDSALRSSPDSRLFNGDGEVLVFTANEDDERQRQFQRGGAQIELCPRGSRGLKLDVVLAALAEREINDVLVEAGPTLASAFIEQTLFDELVVYMAPKVIGADARSAFTQAAPLDLNAAQSLEIVDVRRVGPDLRLVFRPPSAAVSDLTLVNP